MTALTAPKGPLPARVYWFRRAMLLSVLFVLVFGTTRVVGGSGDPVAGTEKAATVSAPVAAAIEKNAKKQDATSQGDTKADESKQAPVVEPSPSAEPTPTEKPKPAPVGACTNADVVVTPSVKGPRTSLKVTIDLTLRTRTAQACTFDVSSRSVVVKVDSGPRERPDDIWTSAQCREAIPTRQVTVYKDFDTVVPVVWSGRRSNEGCTTGTTWAKRGWYHANAATYGGEPTAKQFELTRLAPVTVTRTAEPQQKKDEATSTPAARTSTPKPTGAVEPN